MSGALAVLSADYSQDELDAVADAFGVPSLGSTRLKLGGADDTVLRATLATALRGLVARRAIMLSGTAASPRIELLEPHGTLLGTFLGANRVVSAQATERDRIERCVVFVRDEVAVHQGALSGQAIVRMTALPASALSAVVLDALDLDAGGAVAGSQPDGRHPLEVAASALGRLSDELRAAGALPALVDLVHACRRRIKIVDVRIEGRRTERLTVEWLEAGALGWWRVEPDDHDPPVTTRLVPCSGTEPADVLADRKAVA